MQLQTVEGTVFYHYPHKQEKSGVPFLEKVAILAMLPVALLTVPIGIGEYFHLTTKLIVATAAFISALQ